MVTKLLIVRVQFKHIHVQQNNSKGQTSLVTELVGVTQGCTHVVKESCHGRRGS